MSGYPPPYQSAYPPSFNAKSDLYPPSTPRTLPQPAFTKTGNPQVDAQNAFGFYDKNHSGTIDIEEFYSALQFLGASLSWEDSCVAFQCMDANGDRTLSLNEFVEFYVGNYGRS